MYYIFPKQHALHEFVNDTLAHPQCIIYQCANKQMLMYVPAIYLS